MRVPGRGRSCLTPKSNTFYPTARHHRHVDEPRLTAENDARARRTALCPKSKFAPDRPPRAIAQLAERPSAERERWRVRVRLAPIARCRKDNEIPAFGRPLVFRSLDEETRVVQTVGQPPTRSDGSHEPGGFGLR